MMLSNMSSEHCGPSYADLPMEIILQIMSYLNPGDVLEASLTCRRWFNASLHPKFMSRIQIHFDKLQLNDTHDPSSPLNAFAESMRYYTKIYLNQVDLDQANLEFWHRFGAQFIEIVFNSCDLREKTFNAILKQLTNLESLQINSCRELFMSGRLFKNACDREAIGAACVNVKRISLCNNRYLSDALFSRIVSTMKNIQYLNLSGCHISFHNALYRKFYPEYVHDASESVLTFRYIIQFIEFQANHLRYLDFSETLIDGNALTTMAQVNNLKLEQLDLRSCDQLTSVGICSFVRFQSGLVSLDLSHSVRLTDPSVLEICRTLTQLKTLKIRRCRAITDQSIKEIRLLKHLECLDISECDAITSKGFIEGIANQPNDCMIELHVSALNICELAVIKVAESLPSLRLLDLSFCKNAVTNLAVQIIFKHLTKLRTLNLEFCDMISDAGITGMEMQLQVEKYEQMLNRKQSDSVAKSLSESNFHMVDDAQENNDEVDQPIEELQHEPMMNHRHSHPFHISLRSRAEEDIVNDAKRKKIMLYMCEQPLNKEQINCSPYSIVRLKGLRHLNVASCNRISDVSLKYAFDFIELETLSLSKCQQVSAIGIECVLVKCPSIKVFNLSDCHNLTDHAILMISSQMKRLTHLHIERCSQLTDTTLDYIALNCKRLKLLDVRGCRSMSSEPNLRLENLRSLQQILMSKPGPYMTPFGKQPKAPPMPSAF
ncbi:dynein regulatory complex subunit 6-like [Sitodiplosis mosellana]|uniref:dynein regulatory complex subunit 6-like n=1 Tax=Sitodiplosis mosellana TaxID=263140 RepID=UPI0024447A97|nr:dynein regulatory complex subunit 6-like [Sitodiplosis mosellana]